MKTRFNILFGILCALLCTPAYAQDFTRISEQSITGTSRYVGMSGAMTAIGGDPSAAMDNPAGLGLYRRAEAMFSMSPLLDRVEQIGVGNRQHYNIFRLSHASFVWSVPLYKPTDEGVQFFNFMFSYRNRHSFNRSILASGPKEASLGAILGGLTEVNWDIPFCSDRYNASNSLVLQETGYSNEYAFEWAMNISNRWFVGLGLHVQSYLMRAVADYYETFDAYNAAGKALYNENRTTLTYSGTGCSFSAGLIYRPAGWARLGFSIQTPSVGSMNTYTDGTLYALTDSLRLSIAPSGKVRDNAYHRPVQTSTSVAFQIGAYAMLALQYDFAHASFMDNTHSLKAGFEVIPVMGMYINGGYAYESTFKTSDRVVPIDRTFERQDAYFRSQPSKHYASVAVGFRGQHIIAQMAYQYCWQKFHLYAHENAAPYDIHTDTHRIVITLGWHRN